MAGNVQRSRGRRRPADTSWDRVAGWYDGWVGSRGSDYHRALAIPAVLELLGPRTNESILDVGAGQGVLAPYVTAAGARYTGIDLSPRLIALARRRHGHLGHFIVGDVAALPNLVNSRPASTDAAVFLLSIADMDPLDRILGSVAWALRPTGRIVILMLHPGFRIPRHSGWGHDASRNLTYRRLDSYLTPMAVPMRPVGTQVPTRSFHRPLGTYVNTLGRLGFAIDAMLEIPDLDPESRPSRATRSSRRNLDIPLFLGLRAIRVDAAGKPE